MESKTNARYFGFAPLTAAQLTELHALEKDLGAAVVALKPTVALASLSAEQLARLEAFEKKNGLIALACAASKQA